MLDPTDAQAYANALNAFSGTTSSPPPPGPNDWSNQFSSNCGKNTTCGGYWKNADNNLNQFNNFPNGYSFSDCLQNNKSCDDLGALLQFTKGSSGTGGLENADTGMTPADALCGSGVSSCSALSDLNSACSTMEGCSFDSSNLTLYQYTQLQQYRISCNSASGCDNSWLTASVTNGTLHSVETNILSQMNNYANLASQNNTSFQNYMSDWSSGSTTSYNPEAMSFQGLIYINGSGNSSGYAFEANPDCNPFTLDGSLITTQSSVEIENGTSVSFIYDPSQVFSYVQNTSSGGYRTRIVWMTVW